MESASKRRGETRKGASISVASQRIRSHSIDASKSKDSCPYASKNSKMVAFVMSLFHDEKKVVDARGRFDAKARSGEMNNVRSGSGT
jgi:hypothetical protein